MQDRSLPLKPAVLADLIRRDYRDPSQAAAVWRREGMASSLYVKNGLVVLVCRGSDDWRDWARNFRFLPRPDYMPGPDYEWRLWHRGFLVEARAVAYWSDQACLNLAKSKPDVITGHSRGAAIAQILSTWWQVPAVGFAAPRPAWLKSPKAPCRLYCRKHDVVCLAGRFSGFRHVGDVVWLDGASHGIIGYYLDLCDTSAQ